MSSVAADRYVEATDSASNELSILPESIDLNDREAIREAIDELSTGWSVDICEDDINFPLSVLRQGRRGSWDIRTQNLSRA